MYPSGRKKKKKRYYHDAMSRISAYVHRWQYMLQLWLNNEKVINFLLILDLSTSFNKFNIIS